MTTLLTDNLRGRFAPLFLKYSSELRPQPAGVEVNIEDQTVSGYINPEIGNAVAMRFWNNRSYVLNVSPSIDGDALADWIEENGEKFEEIFDGSSVEWDGSNRVGYLSDRAKNLLDELQRDLDELSLDESLETWEVDEWLANSTEEDLRKPSETLEAAAERIENEALRDRILLVGDVVEYLAEKLEASEDL